MSISSAKKEICSFLVRARNEPKNAEGICSFLARARNEPKNAERICSFLVRARNEPKNALRGKAPQNPTIAPRFKGSSRNIAIKNLTSSRQNSVAKTVFNFKRSKKIK